MTKTTADVELELDGKVPTAAVAEAVAKHLTTGLDQVRAMTPAGRLGWLEKALGELGLPTDCLAQARRLAATERDLGHRQVGREMQARQRRQEALAALVADPVGGLDAAGAATAAEAVWLDTPAGAQYPPAVALVRDARRTIASQIDGAMMAAAEHVFGMVRVKATEVVAEVAALPKIPDGVWTLRDAANELAKIKAHRSTWGTLIAAGQDFRLATAIGDLFRDTLGLGPYGDMDGAPPWALVYRAWPKVLADPEWLNVRRDLRLPYAVQHGFEPGMWLPSEITVTAEDKSFRGRLANLGFAVRSS